MYLLYLLSSIFGLAVGSFLNVVLYRSKNNLSIITPKSFCPKCKYSIPFYRNIPLVSFFLQNGKCNNCSKKISYIYPIIEFCIGLVFLMSALFLDLIEHVFFIWMFSNLMIIIIIDQRQMIIPITPIFLMIISIIIYHIIYLDNLFFTLSGALIGTGYLSFSLMITWIIYKKQTLGFGDLQLIAVLGAWLGPFKIIWVIILSSIVALISIGIISYKKGIYFNKPIPFAPFLSVSAIIIYIIN
tara:strand:- start:717 stop:1442 length:726 start_codon:yes stop_codon:yes gene_type:complete